MNSGYFGFQGNILNKDLVKVDSKTFFGLKDLIVWLGSAQKIVLEISLRNFITKKLP